MTALTWLLTWLLQLLPAMSELQQPVNLTLTSAHFNTMLKWEPGSGTSKGASYSVTFITDTGASWSLVPDCQLIQQPLVCNLTEVFSDPNETYFAQVITLLETQKSQPTSSTEFKLIRDSQLDLPLLTVTQCGTNLCVDLQLPKSYKLNMSQHHRDIYNSSIKYKLNIKINGADIQMQEREIHYLQKHIVMPVVPGKSYCVSVCFWDKFVRKVSNCSQLECAVIPGLISTDPWISAGLCVLVILVLVIMAFLFCTGFIDLSKRPLPPVLTSVRHIEEVLVNAASSMSLSSILTVKAVLPSSGERRHKQSSSDESDGESEKESTGGDYKLRVLTNLLSSSSSSSSCLSAPVGPEPEPQPLLSSNQTSNSTETPSSSAQSNTLSTHTDRGTVGTTNPDEEEEEKEVEVVEEEGSQDVNLLTLTFGRHEVQEEEREEEEQVSHLDIAEVEQETPSVSEENSITSVQPSQPGDTSDTAIETASCSVDEEDEEEDDASGYMGRPCTAVLQRLL